MHGRIYAEFHVQNTLRRTTIGIGRNIGACTAGIYFSNMPTLHST